MLLGLLMKLMDSPGKITSLHIRNSLDDTCMMENTSAPTRIGNVIYQTYILTTEEENYVRENGIQCTWIISS